jgi:hypothetical protein
MMLRWQKGGPPRRPGRVDRVMQIGRMYHGTVTIGRLTVESLSSRLMLRTIESRLIGSPGSMASRDGPSADR